MMQLQELCRQPTVTVVDHDSVADVAARMRFNNVGSAAVVNDDNFLVGIITERVVVRAVADGIEADKTRVDDYMTKGPTVIGPETGVRDAARIMLQGGLRHLPVVAPDGSLVGMASIRDLLFDLLWSPRPF